MNHKPLLFITYLLALMSCLNAGAQVKIGEITIDKETASKYFTDCYLRPDTIALQDWSDYICKGCQSFSYTHEQGQAAKARANAFNDELRRNTIRQLIDTTYYPAGYDTLFAGTYILTGAATNNKNRKIDTIYYHEAGSYIRATNKYLVPRKPSEIDFIKWVNRQNIKL